MSDIVRRLRVESDRLCSEAADEIERLNADREKYFLENLKMTGEIERLRAALQEIRQLNNHVDHPIIEKIARRALEPPSQPEKSGGPTDPHRGAPDQEK